MDIIRLIWAVLAMCLLLLFTVGILSICVGFLVKFACVWFTFGFNLLP